MITNFSEANMAIADFWADNRDGLDAVSRASLAEIIASPVPPEKVSMFCEFVYANRGSFSADAKAVAAEVCGFATSNAFFGLADNARGHKMTAILNGLAVEDEPAPLDRLVSSQTA